MITMSRDWPIECRRPKRNRQNWTIGHCDGRTGSKQSGKVTRTQNTNQRNLRAHASRRSRSAWARSYPFRFAFQSESDASRVPDRSAMVFVLHFLSCQSMFAVNAQASYAHVQVATFHASTVCLQPYRRPALCTCIRCLLKREATVLKKLEGRTQQRRLMTSC